MSMLLMVQAMKAKVGNPLRKLVLVKLADQANDDGECWPSYQSIADACEMSRRTVISHIEWLEEKGFLRRNYRKSKEGLSRSNVFVLTIDSSANAAPRSANNSPSSANAAPPGSANAALGGANAAPIETVNESTNVESVNESGARDAHATHATPPDAFADSGDSFADAEQSPSPSLPIRERASSADAGEVAKEGNVPRGNDSHYSREGMRTAGTVGKRLAAMTAFTAFLVERGVNQQVARDWWEHRDGKPMTETAWARHCQQAAKAGISPQEAAAYAAGREWRGFHADAYQRDELKANSGRSGYEQQAGNWQNHGGNQQGNRKLTPVERVREAQRRYQEQHYGSSHGGEQHYGGYGDVEDGQYAEC